MAELVCGHTQHVRHTPPMQDRPWVLSEAGRAEKIGQALECLFCNMAHLPEGLSAYKRTPLFDAQSIPAGILNAHQTRPGVWAKICVEAGMLEYTCDRGVFVLRPGIVGIVEPEKLHHVRPLSEVQFFVQFLKADS